MNAGGRKLAGRDEMSVRLREESSAEKNADEKTNKLDEEKMSQILYLTNTQKEHDYEGGNAVYEWYTRNIS